MNRNVLIIIIVVLGVLGAATASYITAPSAAVLPQKPPVGDIKDINSVVTVDWLADHLGAKNLKVIYIGTGGGAKRSYGKGNRKGD